MAPPRTPVLFLRNITGRIANAWNHVVLEDEAGDAINAANPLPVGVAPGGIADPLPVTLETAAGAAVGTAANPLRIDPTNATVAGVDVINLPAVIQGPGNPVVDSYNSAVVNLAASTTNQVLVAAPGANKQIWLYGLFMMADTAAGTVTLQDEDDTALSGTMAVSDEGGWVLPMSGNFAMPWIKVATNKALEADTGACTVDGILTYAIVSV